MSEAYSAPFIRLFYQNTELTHVIERFKYVYSESEDDVCELVLKFDNRKIANNSEFSERAEWLVTWGFLGTTNQKTRKIFLQDFKWEYGKQIQATLLFTDKATILKNSTSNRVYNNTSLPQIAGEMGKAHGLKVEAQITTPQNLTKSNKISDVVADIENNTPKKPEENKGLTWSEALSIKPKTIIIFDPSKPHNLPTHLQFGVKPNMSAQDLIESYNNYQIIPQANRSDAQLLENLGLREKGGNTIISTRDDGIVLKKRNFNQVPYRAYEYTDGSGILQSFTPEYQSRLSQGNSVNLAFGGWDAANKEFMTGNANALYDNLPESLTKLKEMVTYLTTLNQSEPVGKFYLGADGLLRYNKSKVTYVYKPDKLAGGRPAYNSLADETKALKDIKIPLKVSDKITALNAIINRAQATNLGGNIYDPTTGGPGNLFNSAANARNNTDLQKNPANLELEGDPNLEEGMVITILGVAEAHMGNYYIIRATHTMDKLSPYTVELDLVRDGNNYAIKNPLDVTKLGKKVNTKVGSKKPLITKKVTIKQ